MRRNKCLGKTRVVGISLITNHLPLPRGNPRQAAHAHTAMAFMRAAIAAMTVAFAAAQGARPPPPSIAGRRQVGTARRAHPASARGALAARKAFRRLEHRTRCCCLPAPPHAEAPATPAALKPPCRRHSRRHGRGRRPRACARRQLGRARVFPFPSLDSLSPFCSRTDSGGTGRDLLFSNPGASLPDIYLSDSVKFASEGGHFFYSIVLTHPPGMREDETVSRV